MDTEISRRKKLLASLMLFVTGITALAGGWLLMTDPSGAALRLDVALMKNFAFSSYRIPGIILFTVLGVGSMIELCIIHVVPKLFSHMLVAAGVCIGGWITVQIIIINQLNGLQVVYLTIAIIFLMIARSERGGSKSYS